MKIRNASGRNQAGSVLAKLSLTLGLALVVGLPAAAQAQDNDVRNYDGYCYAKQKDARTEGTVVGAIIGGLIGSQVSKNERGLGAVGGAVIGGAVGRNAGKSSVKCYNGEYYSYQGSYYDPAPPPQGYTTVYYKTRPSQDHYSNVYYDRQHHTSPPPYGYGNAWQNDNNNPNGWRDSNGNWHSNQDQNDHGHHN